MKKFFTLVLMLFASLHLFANAEIVIFKGERTVNSSSAMQITKDNFVSFIEANDKIIVTISDFVAGEGAYFQINWATYGSWKNNPSITGDGDVEILIDADDITVLNKTEVSIINFSANSGCSYKVTQVKVVKNNSYADLEDVTLSEASYSGGYQYQKVWSNTPAAALKMSDGDLLVVVGKSDENSGGSWSMRELSTWDNVYSTGSFDGRDYAYIVASGKGSRIHADGFQFVTNKQMSAVKIAKKIYSLSETSDFDFSSVVTDSPVNVKLTRSITAGNWSTIVLPFAMTSAQLSSTFGAGVSVAELQNTSTADELIFSTVSATEANKPYAIKVASGFSSATISYVTIVSATPTQGTTKWNFVGTYTSGNIPEGSYFFQNNALYYAEGTGNHIKGFRAYFTPNGIGVRGFVGFSVDGQTTGIHSTLYDSTNKGDGKIYSLSGQIVTAPQKGVVYIVDGKKVIFNK